MSSTIYPKKCPICDSTCLSTETVCTKCGWDLTLNHDYHHLDEKILQKTQTATRIVYQKLKKLTSRYRQERDELRTQMDEIKDLPQQVFELQLRISELEKEIESSSLQQKDIEQLKQEILLELENKFRDIIERQNLQSTAPSSNVLKENFKQEENDNIRATEDIDNTENKQEKNDRHDNQQPQINNNEESYVIREYSQNTKVFSQYTYKVTLTKKCLENIYINRANEIIFEISNQSDYWVFNHNTIHCYLLPKLDFKININIKAVRTIFELQQYKENNTSKQFLVTKPARVQEIDNQKWKLIERGILSFN